MHYTETMEWFIPGNVPSKKNSLHPRNRGKRMISSKYEQYKRSVESYLIKMSKSFKKALKEKEKPYEIGFFFIKPTKHAADYTNKIDTVQDVLVSFGLLPSDEMDVIKPIPLGYEVNREKAGVIIRLL